MRAANDIFIEDCRVAGAKGSRSGEFLLRNPRSGQKFSVIANDDSEWAELGLPLPPWEHVSVACQSQKRCPTWDELCWIKGLFWGDEELVLQFHPPKSKYVNIHPNVLHLWKPVGVEIPMPPMRCV